MLNVIEKTCLDAYRAGADPLPEQGGGDTNENWIRFGLRLLLDAGRMVRQQRMTSGQDGVEFKDDGSPATLLEAEVEALLRDRLALFEPRGVVIGEETGGTFSSSGIAVAIDPVDGTWAFLSGTANYATTLAVFRDGTPIVGAVSNPTTGEIGYAVQGGGTRLVQLSVFGETDMAGSLPEKRTGSAVLVNLHPSKGTRPTVGAFHDAWKRGELGMVRSPGGSPAWSLLEAARGRFTYVNLWSSRPAEAYDLVAGVMLVRGAGGDVIDPEGRSIDALDHGGPFIAGVDGGARQKAAEITHKAING